jgi:protein O-GlcNAc transferase
MRVLLCLYFFCLIIIVYTTEKNFWDKLNLEPSLLPWHISSDKFLRKQCLQDLIGCPVMEKELKKERCFGFEKTCEYNENCYSFNKTKCSKNSSGHRTPEQQKKKFWEQGDFGYAIPRIQNMKEICSSKNKEGSFLECSDNLRMCKAKNIFFNFKSFDAKKSKRYRNDILKEGEVGGNCDEVFDKRTLHSRLEEKSYLQSWGHEFEYFDTYPDFIINNENCDIIFEKPTIVIKLDASINLYHHFCDFINLYLTQFINGTFSQDVDVLWWDTYTGGFVDSYFGDAWKAFTFNKPKELIHLQNKRVCFRNALFPLLARQRLGIYYNMPLIDGCQGSGLFHAFTRHFLYRLNVSQNGPIKDKLRITILQRDSIARRIINIEEVCFIFNIFLHKKIKIFILFHRD